MLEYETTFWQLDVDFPRHLFTSSKSNQDGLYFYSNMCGHDAALFLGFLCYLKLNRLLYFNFNYLHKYGCLLL